MWPIPSTHHEDSKLGRHFGKRIVGKTHRRGFFDLSMSTRDLTCMALYGVVWLFPKIMVPPNHPFSSILIGFSIINHPFWGFSPYFWKHPYGCIIVICFSKFVHQENWWSESTFEKTFRTTKKGGKRNLGLTGWCLVMSK